MADVTQEPPAAEETDEASEAQIAVHWREEEYYPPPSELRRAGQRQRAGDPPALQRRELPGVLRRVRRSAHVGAQKWDTIVDTSNPPFFKWYVGGRLNACVNCVDRHLEIAR